MVQVFEVGSLENERDEYTQANAIDREAFAQFSSTNSRIRLIGNCENLIGEN
jgi:hypothetical protein